MVKHGVQLSSAGRTKAFEGELVGKYDVEPILTYGLALHRKLPEDDFILLLRPTQVGVRQSLARPRSSSRSPGGR
jgi:hypothetical protein